MAERSKPTLEHLRKLARKHLGPGYSKFRRADLIEALKKVVPGLEQDPPAKTTRRRAPAVQSAMKKTPQDEAVPEKKESKEAARAKKVSIQEVVSEHEQKRAATLKKKAGSEPLDAVAKKGARPVTAHVSKGVARVKSAIANIAREVESRREARETAKTEATVKKVAASNVEIQKVGTAPVASKAVKMDLEKGVANTVREKTPPGGRKPVSGGAAEAAKKEGEAEKKATAEAAKKEAARAEAAKKAAAETAKKEAARAEAEKKEAAAAEKKAAEAARKEAARLEAEKAEVARKEAARAEAEKAEASRKEAVRIEAEKAETARREAARVEAERAEAARKEAVRIEAERAETARKEAARAEAEKAEAARKEAARLDAEKKEEGLRKEAARLEAEKADAARKEAARLESEKAEATRKEAARLDAEKAETARKEAARLDAEKAEAARTEAARLDAEKAETARKEAARLDAEKAEAAKKGAARIETETAEAARLDAAKRALAAQKEAARVEAERADTARKEAAQQPAPSSQPGRTEPSHREAKRVGADRPNAAASRTPAQPSSTPPAFVATPQPGNLLARATLEEAPSRLAGRSAAPPVQVEEAPAPAPISRRRRSNALPSEAVVEGFFVARIAGRMEALRHHMAERATSRSASSLGLSAPTFRRIVLLPRDPETLFLYFDLSTAGVDSRPGERVVVRLFDDGQVLRQFDPEELAHGYYVTGLQSLRTYYAEAWAIAGDGGERFLGPSSNAVTLPGVGAPAERVRFLRVPWALPLPRLRDRSQLRVVERDGEVRVSVRSASWHQEGTTAWEPSLSGSGVGRWVRRGAIEDVEETVAHEREVEVREDQRDTEWTRPTSSGAGMPSSFKK